MNAFMLSKKRFIPAVALSLFCFVGFADASGSYSAGTKSVDNKKEAQYHKGKSVLRKKLLCDTCPLDGEKLSKSTAPDILQKLKSGEFSTNLNSEEEKAVSVYLSRRYHIK